MNSNTELNETNCLPSQRAKPILIQFARFQPRAYFKQTLCFQIKNIHWPNNKLTGKLDVDFQGHCI